MIPQQVELMREKSPDDRRHLGQGAGEIASILDGFAQDGHPMAIHLPRAGIHHGAFGRRSQNVRDEFIVRVGGFEARIVAFHTPPLTAQRPIPHTQRNRLFSGR
jgi:hypothetical protein